MTALGTSSIFEDGKLKSGIYKIQNLYTDNFLDIHPYSMGTCCRPAAELGAGRGLWEIRRLVDGYAVWRVDPGQPHQFCNPMEGLENGSPLSVSTYSAAWRIERVTDEVYRPFEYVRFFWGSTNKTWDLWSEPRDANGAIVALWNLNRRPWQVWKLIPVGPGSTTAVPIPAPEIMGLGPPPYDESAPVQPAAHVQHWYERDDSGTAVTEVTVVTIRRKIMKSTTIEE